MARITSLLAVVCACLIASPAYSALIIGADADGQKLIGTGSGGPDGNDNDSRVNTLISNYNTAFGTLLTTPVSKIDKWEAPGGLEDGVLNASLFTFFEQVSQANSTTSITFEGITMYLKAIDSSDLNDVKIGGFLYTGPEQFDIGFYAVKSGNAFSLWTYTPGVINPMYVDPDADLDGVIQGNGAGTSHVTFYDGGDGPSSVVVPEPTSFALVACGLVSGCLGQRRRKSAKA